MVDTVCKETRSRIMSRIRGKDTKPELLVRKLLFRNGYRYRLHHKGLPGKPDIVLPRHNAIVLVNGCFWHGHGHCGAKRPSSNTKFWNEKIANNKARDVRNVEAYRKAGWRTLVIWECCVKDERLETDVLKWFEGDGDLSLPERKKGLKRLLSV